MYVRFGYAYSRQSNYCALVTSVQNTLVSYRKVRFLPLTLIYATLGFYVSLVAKHNLSLYAHMRLYFTHKMTEKRYLSAKYHFIRYLFSPYNRHHNTLFADK